MTIVFSSEAKKVGTFSAPVLFSVYFSYRYTITMSVRTYNPSVLIGNWNEDVCLEEVGIFEQFQCNLLLGQFTDLF